MSEIKIRAIDDRGGTYALRAKDFKNQDEAKKYIKSVCNFKVKSFKEVYLVHRRWFITTEDGDRFCNTGWKYANIKTPFAMKAWEFYYPNNEFQNHNEFMEMYYWDGENYANKFILIRLFYKAKRYIKRHWVGYNHNGS